VIISPPHRDDVVSESAAAAGAKKIAPCPREDFVGTTSVLDEVLSRSAVDRVATWSSIDTVSRLRIERAAPARVQDVVAAPSINEI
jgi:hypothetical protein